MANRLTALAEQRCKNLLRHNLETLGSTTQSSTDILRAFLLQLESQTLANLTVEQLVRSQYEALAQNILVSPAVNKDSGISEEVHEG